MSRVQQQHRRDAAAYALAAWSRLTERQRSKLQRLPHGRRNDSDPDYDVLVCAQLAMYSHSPTAREQHAYLRTAWGAFVAEVGREHAASDGNSGGDEPDEDEELSPLRAAFKAKCERFGLKPTDIGRKFLYETKVFTLIGMQARGRKYFIVRNSGGELVKLETRRVVCALRNDDRKDQAQAVTFKHEGEERGMAFGPVIIVEKDGSWRNAIDSDIPNRIPTSRLNKDGSRTLEKPKPWYPEFMTKAYAYALADRLGVPMEDA